MNQRLGVAAALLGDPPTLILDEPSNGLDPEGILWIRNLLKRLAAQGRTVFLSSHLMAEISQTADHLVVIGRGRLITDTSTSEILAEASKGGAVTVRTPQGEQLRRALAADGVVVLCPQPGLLEVQGLTSAEVGTVAAREGIVLHELVAQRASLEDAFMRLTGDAVEYHALVGDEQPESAGVAA